MISSIHLAGISGSLRMGSYNTMLLNAVGELLPVNCTMSILSIADIPLYTADLDIPQVSTRPLAVKKFRDELDKAQGIVICSPEYNYSIPGVLKNAIDWASRGEDNPLQNKPAVLMGATPGKGGTIRMQNAFAPIFLYLGMQQVLKPEIIISSAPEKFDKDGLLTDEKIRSNISRKMETLVEMIKKSLVWESQEH